MKKKIKYSNTDFDISLLPVTRGKQIAYFYKNRLSLVFAIGLVFAVFSIPLIAFIIMRDFAINSFGNDNFKEIAFTNFLFQICLFFYLLILSICLSGITNIIKRMFYSESIFFWKDFAIGVKENIKVNLIVTIIYGLLYLVSYLVMLITNFNALGMIPFILFLAIFVPSYIWVILENTIYKEKTFILIKNSFFFYGKKLVFSLLISLMFLSPLFTVFLNDFIIKIIVTLLINILIVPIVLFLTFNISLNTFDFYINKDNFVEYYRKGLYQPGKEEL